MINVILVESEGDQNIGMVTRAMKNMDVSRLILVHPLCDHLSRDARNYSVHAQDILESAVIVDTLDDAIKGSDLSVAITRRSGQWRKKDFWLEDLAVFLRDFEDKTVSLVFGREQSGLTNDEIRACDVQCAIPSSRQFPSLNLAQAVMVTLYEIFKTRIKGHAPARPVSSREDFDAMTAKIFSCFESLDFFKNSQRDRLEYYINKILVKASLDKKDIQAVGNIFRRIEGVVTGLKKEKSKN